MPTRSIGFFGLSNILELVRSDFRLHLSAEVARVAAPGARVCVRSILPPRGPMLPVVGRLAFDRAASARLSARDLSLFCHFAQVYRLE